MQLCGKDGGIAVAAVALALDVGAVHHIAAERQATERVVNHVVDGTEILVVADERGFLLVAGMDEHACDVREGRLTVESLYLDISVGVVVELVAEGLLALAACDVVVCEDALVEVAAHGQHVAVADGDALPLA